MPTNDYLENNNSYSKTVKDVRTDRIEVEVGDTKQPSKFYPQVKLMRWDNEVNFSARLKDETVASETVSKDTNIVYKKGNITANFYELPVSKELPEGGYEFEIDLASKPLTNKIEFTIQTKGLNFFYQPELTEKEKLLFVRRPENIVGSYAVYYKNCPPNFVGGKEYKSGKAFHIYRPKISDNEENWV